MENTNVIDYVTVTSGHKTGLDNAVKHNLEAGWFLYGSPYVNVDFCQAMVKYSNR